MELLLIEDLVEVSIVDAHEILIVVVGVVPVVLVNQIGLTLQGVGDIAFRCLLMVHLFQSSKRLDDILWL